VVSLLEDLKLYPKFLAIAMRSSMQYRSDFVIGIFGVLFASLSNLALIWIILDKFKSLAGWYYWEIVMLYGMWQLSHSFYEIFFRQVSGLTDLIISGRFDGILYRPTNTFVQVIASELNFRGFAELFLAVLLFILAYKNLALSWPLYKFGLLLILLLSGTIIEASINVITASIAFWTGRTRGFFDINRQFNSLVQQYPIDLFNRWFNLFISSILPMAFVNYYPIANLLKKPNALSQPILGYLSPIVALVSFLLASIIWRFGIANYGSTGS